MNWYGAQRARQLRPRCIETVRSQAQLLINQSVFTGKYGIGLFTICSFCNVWHQMLFAQFRRWVESFSLKWKCECSVLSTFIFLALSQNCQKRLFLSSFLFCPSVCPPVRMELGCHWTDFHEIWYLNIFRNSVVDIQVALKPYWNNEHFTWRPVHIFLISRWILLRMRNVSDESCRENQNTF
jgi:hypothetical protein